MIDKILLNNKTDVFIKPKKSDTKISDENSVCTEKNYPKIPIEKMGVLTSFVKKAITINDGIEYILDSLNNGRERLVLADPRTKKIISKFDGNETSVNFEEPLGCDNYISIHGHPWDPTSNGLTTSNFSLEDLELFFKYDKMSEMWIVNPLGQINKLIKTKEISNEEKQLIEEYLQDPINIIAYATNPDFIKHLSEKFNLQYEEGFSKSTYNNYTDTPKNS